jgi:hypothetical protein
MTEILLPLVILAFLHSLSLEPRRYQHLYLIIVQVRASKEALGVDI